MTYLRTFADITLAAISFSTTATADALQGARSERIAVVATEEIEIDEPAPELLTTDIINAAVPEIEGTLENPVIYKLLQ